MKDNRSGRGRMAGARAVIAIITVALAAAICPAARAGQLNIMPQKDLKPGMKGVGRTVFKGSSISDFPVEVLGVVPGAGPGGCNLILIKVTGNLVENNGGVAMGMSGSPIYINKKLVGALSTAFPDTSHSLAGVTPIEDMLAEVEYLEAPAKTSFSPPIKFEGKSYDSVIYASGPRKADGALYAKSAVAPISIRGVNKRSYTALRTFFAASGLDVLPFTGATAAATAATPKAAPSPVAASGLRPGSSVAVQLARGDLDISAVGTVTVVDGKKILIFGHPFFTRGKVEYLLSDASVITIVQDREAPYKLATSGQKRGVIYQDRGKALLGYIGKFPEMLPVKVTIEDKDINRKQSFSVDVVPDDDLIPNLIVAIMLNALDKSIDRIGPGAAEVTFAIKTKGLDTAIERKNTFYSSFDITAESLSELMVALEMIRGNHYKDVKITGLEATVLVDSSRSTASIVEAELFDPSKPEKEKAGDKKEDAAVKDDTSDGAEHASAEDASSVDETPDADDESDGAETADLDEDYIPDDSDIADYDDSGDEEAGPAADAEDSVATAEDASSDLKESAASQAGSIAGKGGKRKAKALQKVYPGQKLCLKVTLLPYRKENIERKIYLKVPKDIASGTAIIDVYSGMKYQRSMGGLEQMISAISDSGKPGARDQGAGDGYGPGKKPKKKTLEDIFRNFLDRDKNNELVATITSLSATPKDKEDNDTRADSGSGSSDPDSEALPEDDYEPLSKDRARKLTEYVLTGSTTIRVKVENKTGKTAVKSGKIRKSRISALEDNGDQNDGKKDSKKEGKK